ncbi:uroporphyrinogen-III synthase [Asticcacaulis solisilvae]|uniref:uroporphyrinogen-III synthase n=1 Tax=Asticcacaulis solisilvae TaxID=1217274 RepID=UPI003FD8CBC4
MSEPCTVWITRTADGADRTARAVEALGHIAIAAPVLAVEALDVRLDTPFDAVIFTSRNGVRAFSARSDHRGATAWCVGDATADAARDAGFAAVVSAEGDVEALFALMKSKAPRDARYIYASAKQPSAPLTAWLWAEGFRVTQAPVYDTVAVRPELRDADLGRITHVLIHSARGGREAARYLTTHGKFAFTNPWFICMSEGAWQGFAGAAGALSEGARHRIAHEPTEAAMLDLLGADIGQ